jgi:GNAT superfamily N-acetyltransferase
MVSWRLATGADAPALRDIEREANLVGLAHVFPAAEFPFPDDDVEARWAATLADPGVTVELGVDPQPLAFSAWDAEGRLRHLAVVPAYWGTGLARAGVDRAVTAIRAAGRTPRLWVLEANDRARGLYEHLGWSPTGREQRSEWPPHPMELELELRESPRGR